MFTRMEPVEVSRAGQCAVTDRRSDRSV